jgi:hypothetical protein
MKVQVYRNLHTGGYSVRDIKTGRVILHADEVGLSEVSFHVQPAGRRRVLKERQKNVHAYAKGILELGVKRASGMVQVSYNPYRHESFVRAFDESPIYRARLAFLDDSGCFVLDA